MATSSLNEMFQPPPESDKVDTENTALLERKDSPLRDLFQPVEPKVLEVPIKGDDEESHRQSLSDGDRKVSFVDSCKKLVTPDCFKSTLIGSFVFLLFHVVFCLAQSSSITRPHASTPIIGPVAKMAALGILLASPVFVANLGHDIPAIYPTSDLFLAPFLANLAVTIDECLYQDDLQDEDKLFLATFTAVSSSGLFLSAIMCVLAARFKLADLGAFLPYSVLCGFFSVIGLLMWTLAFSVDNGGKKIGQVLLSGDWGLIANCLIHHFPSLCIGIIMHVFGPTHPLFVVFLVFLSICGAYLVMLVTGTSLAEAQAMGWFYSSEDLVGDVNAPTGKIGFAEWEPPAPFGIINTLFRGGIHWGAFKTCLPTVFALAFLYVIRSSLHAAAVKKNIPNVTRKKPASEQDDPPKAKKPVALQKILEKGYGYAQFMASISGSICVAPAVAVALTLFKVSVLSGVAYQPCDFVHLHLFFPSVQMGAEGEAPQYGSFALLGIFYLTDFVFVRFIPKPAFSCLLVLAFLDMVSVWLIGSYRKTKHKWEWLVCPLIIVLTFSVGLLSAVVVGVLFSTIIFVGSFYRSGVVKYLANGLTLRSTIERGYRESVWLDQNGDLIQVLVLQNYLFFGNAQSLNAYISTMFDDTSEEDAAQYQDLMAPLPPPPLYIIMDFTIVSGMDTSAIDLLRETMTLCKNHKCRLYLSGMAQSLRSSLVYAGVKPDGKTLFFQPDLETALGKAEDGILDSVFHVVEQTEHDVGLRRRKRALSNADDGFRYALEKIDEHHGLNYAPELVKLEKYTRVVELKPGESLFQNEGGSVKEEDRGFFFIEHGLMTIERDPSQSNRNTMSLRTPFAQDTSQMRRVDSIGHLDARAATLAREDAQMKQVRRGERGKQNFRLARIGTGWIVGTIEGASGLKNSGLHIAGTSLGAAWWSSRVAEFHEHIPWSNINFDSFSLLSPFLQSLSCCVVTECRLHLLSFERVAEIEKKDPALILSLFRLCSHLSARRQELTIEQLTQYMTILNSPAHTSHPINRATLASLRRNMIS